MERQVTAASKRDVIYAEVADGAVARPLGIAVEALCQGRGQAGQLELAVAVDTLFSKGGVLVGVVGDDPVGKEILESEVPTCMLECVCEA